MNKMNQKQNEHRKINVYKNLQHIMSKRFMSKIIRTSVIYILILIMGMFFARQFFRIWTWYGNELLYPFLHFFSSNATLTVTVVFLLGFMGIFAYYWRKIIKYFMEVINGMEYLYMSLERPIELSSDLYEVEMQMNQIRANILRERYVAKEAKQRKNDLIVYLAHDLKTPLTSVIGYLTLLNEEVEMPEQSKHKYLSVALQKSQRLEDLINEFFEITRFNLTNLELEKSTINLTRMLEQIIYEFEPLFRDKNMTCELKSKKDVMYVCDPGKLMRVFDNLLKNGLNYSYENSAMEVTIDQRDEKITITFMNQGPTIPPEKQQRIFEQFYRLDQARRTSFGGAGLGLAIAKEIVHIHGGEIKVKSDNEETQFFVLLNVTE